MLRRSRRMLLCRWLGLGLIFRSLRRGFLGGGWLWLRLRLRLRVGATIIEPPLGVEHAIVFGRKVVVQTTREIELSVTASRALVRYRCYDLLAIVRDGELFAADSGWVNRVAAELG